MSPGEGALFKSSPVKGDVAGNIPQPFIINLSSKQTYVKRMQQSHSAGHSDAVSATFLPNENFIQIPIQNGIPIRRMRFPFGRMGFQFGRNEAKGATTGSGNQAHVPDLVAYVSCILDLAES